MWSNPYLADRQLTCSEVEYGGMAGRRLGTGIMQGRPMICNLEPEHGADDAFAYVEVFVQYSNIDIWHTHTHIYIYIYIYIFRFILDFPRIWKYNVCIGFADFVRCPSFPGRFSRFHVKFASGSWEAISAWGPRWIQLWRVWYLKWCSHVSAGMVPPSIINRTLQQDDDITTSGWSFGQRCRSDTAGVGDHFPHLRIFGSNQPGWKASPPWSNGDVDPQISTRCSLSQQSTIIYLIDPCGFIFSKLIYTEQISEIDSRKDTTALLNDGFPLNWNPAGSSCLNIFLNPAVSQQSYMETMVYIRKPCLIYCSSMIVLSREKTRMTIKP